MGSPNGAESAVSDHNRSPSGQRRDRRYRQGIGNRSQTAAGNTPSVVVGRADVRCERNRDVDAVTLSGVQASVASVAVIRIQRVGDRVAAEGSDASCGVISAPAMIVVRTVSISAIRTVFRWTAMGRTDARTFITIVRTERMTEHVPGFVSPTTAVTRCVAEATNVVIAIDGLRITIR